MRKFGVIDFEFSRKHNLSTNEMFLMIELDNLSSWAKASQVDGEIFYYLTMNKILEDIPMIKSKGTLSRTINDLEDKEIIQTSHKHSKFPLYRLTDLGKEWGNSYDNRKNTNDGEIEDTTDTTKKQNSMTLKKSSTIDNLHSEYIEKLKKDAYAYAKKNSIDFEETFRDFINWHKSKGTRFVNWLSAYQTWCNKSNKYNSDKNKDDRVNEYGVVI